MKTNILLEKMKAITTKTYFASADLKKLYPGKNKDLKVVIYRLIKQKRLFRLFRGYYALDLSRVDWDGLACELWRPSYLSFESALHYHGLIDQIPATLTLATTKKSRSFHLPNQALEYSHLKTELFFGYKIVDNYLLAEKEKALLDELYLISLKKRHLSLTGLTLEGLDWRLFKKWLKKYPVYTQRLAKKVLFSSFPRRRSWLTARESCLERE